LGERNKKDAVISVFILNLNNFRVGSNPNRQMMEKKVGVFLVKEENMPMDYLPIN
jgi:hypothetical protein